MMPTQVKHVTFAEAVMLRPLMYTVTGTFGEVVSFLEGYYSGMAKGNLYALPVAEWAAFHKWLAGRIDAGGSSVFVAMHEKYGDAALKQLSEWFSEFQSQM